MTFFRRLFPRLIAVAALSASSFASAASIDFTASSPWSGANNQTTFGAGIQASGRTATFTGPAGHGAARAHGSGPRRTRPRPRPGR
jgi:hypothetical protein